LINFVITGIDFNFNVYLVEQRSPGGGGGDELSIEIKEEPSDYNRERDD
jgi:hypothetical protein